MFNRHWRSCCGFLLHIYIRKTPWIHWCIVIPHNRSLAAVSCWTPQWFFSWWHGLELDESLAILDLSWGGMLSFLGLAAVCGPDHGGIHGGEHLCAGRKPTTCFKKVLLGRLSLACGNFLWKSSVKKYDLHFIPWTLCRSLKITHFTISDPLDPWIKVDSSCFLLYLLSGVICVGCLKNFGSSMWFSFVLGFWIKDKVI